MATTTSPGRAGSADVDSAVDLVELAMASPDELRFRGRRELRPSLLLTPLLLLLGSLPWFAPGSPTSLQLLVSAALLALAALAAREGLPRRSSLVIVPARRELREAAAVLTLAEHPRWLLSAHAPEDSAQSQYRAELELADGRRRVLLQSSDPVALLRDLQRILACWSLPVECAWGLPANAEPWSFAPQPATEAERVGAQGRLVKSRLAGPRLRFALACCAAFVCLDLIYLVSSKLEQVADVHPLSVALAVLIGSCITLLALGVATLEARWVVGERVTAQLGVFGAARSRSSAAAAAVRGVFVIGAEGAERNHVLIDSAEGPLAIEVRRSEAHVTAELTRRALEPAVALSP